MCLALEATSFRSSVVHFVSGKRTINNKDIWLLLDAFAPLYAICNPRSSKETRDVFSYILGELLENVAKFSNQKKQKGNMVAFYDYDKAFKLELTNISLNNQTKKFQMINDESYRRRSITQLNKSEARHGLARELFHGKRGELRQRYREGQEDQLGALGLVLNILVLWNTIYMDAAINQLRADGMNISDEDIARLSPIRWENFNFLGRYSFVLDEIVKQGKLRQLSRKDSFLA